MADAVSQLIDVMQRELDGQQRLTVLLEGKIEAMRHYDLAQLDALNRSEQKLMENLRLHAMRRQEVVQLAAHRLLSGQSHTSVSARELAEAAGEPGRSRVMTLAGLLREVIGQVQRLHRIHAVASRKLMTHFEHVFQVIAQSGRDTSLYGRAGRRELVQHNRLVDATA